jgi:predicted nucleic acid-binding protein
MNGFLLDTNVPSELIRPQPDPKVKAWIAAQSLESLFISVVSFGEFRKGISLRLPGKRKTELEHWLTTDLAALFSGRILPVTRPTAERWGVLEARRQLAGQPLNVPDGQIAATALEHDLTLVTRNVRDFADLDVAVFNPWEMPYMQARTELLP